MVTIEDTPELPDLNIDAESALINDETTRLLYDCLDALEARQHTAIRTAFFFGYTYAELAERDAVSINTMKTRVRRGLNRLRTCLERI